ncbi:hypothetical protein OQA88_3368 [Cercophora sp. LCS_1]
MKGALSIAAVGCAVGMANARLTKWSRDNNAREWSPPQQTLGIMPSLVNNPVFPAPTSPPKYTQRQLERRGSTDNTCGYVEGSTDIPLWCDTTAFCASNSINNHIGCCDDTATECKVWTTCLDSTDRSLYTTDNGLTLWCGFTDYPNCITHIYADTTGPATRIKGYTLLGCAVAKGSDNVFYTPFVEATTKSSSRRSTNTFIVPDTTLQPTNTRATVTVTPDPTPVPASSSSSNAGAIAGGVVGGVAAIALIAFGIWFLIRQKNKNKEQAGSPPPAPAPAPAPMGYGGTPATQMSQNTPPPQGFYGQPAPGYDPRASIAKPQHMSAYSEPAPPSPPPVSPGQFGPNSTPSPPPAGYAAAGAGAGAGAAAYGNVSPYQQSPPAGYGFQGQQQPQQYQSYQPPPQQQGGYQQGYQQGGYQYQQGNQGYSAELPTHRGDSEARELQG